MIKLSIQQDKGGCGKTTTAINLAYGLSKKGYRVLLADNDPQANSTSNILKASKPLDEKEMLEIVERFNGMKNENKNGNILMIAKESLHQYVEKKLFEHTISDVYMNPKIIKEAIVKSEYDNLWVLPSMHELSELDFRLKAAAFNRDTRLREAFDLVKDDFDIVIIDNSPFTNALTFNAMTACHEDGDQIIIPISIDQFGMEGLDYTLKTLFDWIAYAPFAMNYDLKIIIGMTKRTKMCKMGIEMIHEIFGERAFETTIRFQDKPISSSFLKKKVLLDGFSNSSIAQDYQKLIDEIDEKIIRNKLNK